MLLRLLCFNRNLSLELLYSLPFLLQDWLPGYPGLFTDSSELVHFYFFTFQLLVLCCRLIIKQTSTSVSARTLKQHVVSYGIAVGLCCFFSLMYQFSASLYFNKCLSISLSVSLLYLFISLLRTKQQSQIHCHNLLMKTQHAANRTRINREKTLKQKAKTSFTVLASDTAYGRLPRQPRPQPVTVDWNN